MSWWEWCIDIVVLSAFIFLVWSFSDYFATTYNAAKVVLKAYEEEEEEENG